MPPGGSPHPGEAAHLLARYNDCFADELVFGPVDVMGEGFYLDFCSKKRLFSHLSWGYSLFFKSILCGFSFSFSTLPKGRLFASTS